MTTEPTADHSPTPRTTGQITGQPDRPPVPTSAAPYGIAPVAAAVTSPRRRSRRRKLVDAAVVTSTLAALPVAAAWSRAEPTSAERPTLTAAVSQLEDAEDETTLRATTAALHATSQRSATVAAPAAGSLRPAAASSASVTLADMTPDARSRGGTTPAAAPDAGTMLGAPTLGPGTPAANTPAGLAEAAAEDQLTPIARAAGVDLLVPSEATVLVGFHEAGAPGTETFESLAPLAAEHNAKDMPVADDASAEQVAPVIELPTRERAAAASSAIDVAIPEGEAVYAPVSGRVTAVNEYQLYGQYTDMLVEIEPAGKPGVRLVMVHVGGVQVEVGDRVTAGETVVADTAAVLPFDSQIDRFTVELDGRAYPHVHMELKRVAVTSGA